MGYATHVVKMEYLFIFPNKQVYLQPGLVKFVPQTEKITERGDEYNIDVIY